MVPQVACLGVPALGHLLAASGGGDGVGGPGGGDPVEMRPHPGLLSAQDRAASSTDKAKGRRLGEKLASSREAFILPFVLKSKGFLHPAAATWERNGLSEAAPGEPGRGDGSSQALPRGPGGRVCGW